VLLGPNTVVEEPCVEDVVWVRPSVVFTDDLHPPCGAGHFERPYAWTDSAHMATEKLGAGHR
jgi:hypothetical protein